MILDSLEHAERYQTISKAFADAFEFLLQHPDVDLPEGRYEISPDAYAMVKHYTTKPVENCKYEAHRDFADVQYLGEGFEYMGWAPLERMTLGDYREDKDLYAVTGEGDLYPLRKGMFAIVFPEDAHMPNAQMNEPCDAKKIILKVRVHAD